MDLQTFEELARSIAGMPAEKQEQVANYAQSTAKSFRPQGPYVPYPRPNPSYGIPVQQASAAMPEATAIAEEAAARLPWYQRLLAGAKSLPGMSSVEQLLGRSAPLLGKAMGVAGPALGAYNAGTTGWGTGRLLQDQLMKQGTMGLSGSPEYDVGQQALIERGTPQGFQQAGGLSPVDFYNIRTSAQDAIGQYMKHRRDSGELGALGEDDLVKIVRDVAKTAVKGQYQGQQFHGAMNMMMAALSDLLMGGGFKTPNGQTVKITPPLIAQVMKKALGSVSSSQGRGAMMPMETNFQ